MGAALETEDRGNLFDVSTLNTKITVLFGNKFAFAVMDPATNVAALEAGEMFNAVGTANAINFDAECIVDIPKKDYPSLSAHTLKEKFDFGFVQGLRQTTLVAEYWGAHKGHGRTIYTIPMPGTWEVDTEDSIKPFTRLAAQRFTAAPSTTAKAGFHAFKINAKFGDGPLWRLVHTVDYRPNSSYIAPVKHYIRSIYCNRYFVTVFCAREKSTGDFTALSATEWKISHDHTIGYLAKRDGSLTRTVSGPDGRFPSGGNPAAIGEVHRRVLAMAKAGGPLTTPATLRQRVSEATVTSEETNPDFDAGFWKEG